MVWGLGGVPSRAAYASLRRALATRCGGLSPGVVDCHPVWWMATRLNAEIASFELSWKISLC
jgi:hypothetical protein